MVVELGQQLGASKFPASAVDFIHHSRGGQSVIRRLKGKRKTLVYIDERVLAFDDDEALKTFILMLDQHEL